MRWFILSLAVVILTGSSALLAQETVIDDFRYDVAAARAAWKAGPGTPPLTVAPFEPQRERDALRIDCPFSRELRSMTIDRDVALDLTTAARFQIELFISDARPILRVSLCLRSGAGWYIGDYADVVNGRQSASINRVGMRTEGKPAGWQNIDGVRVLVARQDPGDAYVQVARIVAQSGDDSGIVMVIGSHTIGSRGPEAEQAAYAAGLVNDLLADLGMPYAVVDEDAVERGALAQSKVAVFPYSYTTTDAEIAELRKFVQFGGKVIWFYWLDRGVDALLGIKKTDFAREKHPGDFAQIRIGASGIPGMPAEIGQRSWNITVAAPASPKARIIGWWYDARGVRTPYPALLISDTGAFMGHTLQPDDQPAKRKMMLALLGYFRPDIWPKVARHMIASVTAVGYTTVTEESLRRLAGDSPLASKAIERYRQALLSRQQAQEALAAGQPADAITLAEKAAADASHAWRACLDSPDREFRGVWEMPGSRPFDSWDRAMAVLADAHINAVMTNVCWAGFAHYSSKLLAPSPIWTAKGDQLAACIAAARRRGIQVHAWKVNWALGNVAAALVERYRAQGRTQVNVDGGPVNWLCPSHPANLAFERDVMLEIVRNYDIQGLQFDFIRYPSETCCFCAGCRERFEKEIGQAVGKWPQDVYSGPLKAAYQEWRRAQITRLVKIVSEEARKLKPGILISADVFPNHAQARVTVGQDWPEWVRQGYVDFVCPMNYVTSEVTFSRYVAQQVKDAEKKVPVYAGIAASGRFTLTPDQTLGQVLAARQNGAAGCMLFTYDAKLAGDILPALAEGPFRTPAAPTGEPVKTRP